jgi:hypothetical protein
MTVKELRQLLDDVEDQNGDVRIASVRIFSLSLPEVHTTVRLTHELPKTYAGHPSRLASKTSIRDERG